MSCRNQTDSRFSQFVDGGVVGKTVLGDQRGLLSFIEHEGDDVAFLQISSVQIESSKRVQEEQLLGQEIEVAAFDLIGLGNGKANQSAFVDFCQ